MDKAPSNTPTGTPSSAPATAPAKTSHAKVWWFIAGAVIVIGALIARLIHG